MKSMLISIILSINYLIVLVNRSVAGFQASTSSSFICKMNIRILATKRSYSTSYLKMMPEGPEVRTVVDQLQPAVGRRLTG